MSNHDSLKETYVSKYLLIGGDKFYRLLLTNALNKVIIIQEGKSGSITPDLELLKNYNSFLTLYRREGDTTFLEISKIFRKAANKVYRIMLKQGLTEFNDKFLNIL